MAISSSHSFSSSRVCFTNTSFAGKQCKSILVLAHHNLQGQLEEKTWGQRRQWLPPVALFQKKCQGNHSQKFTFLPALRATVRWTANGNIHAHGERSLNGNFRKAEISVFWWVVPWNCMWCVPMCIFYWQCYAFRLNSSGAMGGIWLFWLTWTENRHKTSFLLGYLWSSACFAKCLTN